MNIKITHNWLLDYLETDASPFEIQEYLSLRGPSVEKVVKKNDDYVYEIEITSNRIDAGSVFGIAQECSAILPMFGKKAQLRNNPLTRYRFNKQTFLPSLKKKLTIEVKEKDLASRLTAVVLEDINIGPSPEFIRRRLTLCGIKTINNVVDISNYLMVDLGQPTHIFDYDQIKGKKMILRTSKKGEMITTLDKKTIFLPGGDIVIEDGQGRLIDLCGIMGGINSAVSLKTKRIVFFVQTYNQHKIRKTTMVTGQRTMAASFFEKGLDEERVETALVYGIKLLEKYSQAKISSPLIDIYPHPYKPRTILFEKKNLDKKIGIKIETPMVISILKSLFFKVKKNPFDDNELKISVPSHRKNDIFIQEDLIEEVARIYGYENLPANLPPLVFVEEFDPIKNLFRFQTKLKYFLKHLGLTEVMNYSMISKKLTKNLGLEPGNFLHLTNPISDEIELMRPSLLPSLIKNIAENEGKTAFLSFFEIAKVYWPSKGKPKENYKLGLITNTDFFDIKGIIEAILREFNVVMVDLKIEDDRSFLYKTLFDQEKKVLIIHDKNPIGVFGQLREDLRLKLNLKSGLFMSEIDLSVLANNFKTIPLYKPINPYAVIKLDLNLDLSQKLTFLKFKKIAIKESRLLQKIELVDLYKNKATVRLYFSSNKRNLREEEAKQELERIKRRISSLNN